MEKFLWRDKELFYRVGKYEDGVLKDTLERDSYKLAQCHLPESGLVVDIGGHIGSFAVLASTLYPNLKIRSYEMVPENFEIFKLNISSSGTKNVEFHNGVVYGETLPKGFAIHPTNSGGSRVVWVEGNNEPIKDSFRIVDLITESVCLLKMDCEGMEHDLIDSLVSHDKLRLVDKMTLEYHNFWGKSGDVLGRTLKEQGFKTEVLVYNKDCGLIWAYRDRW